MMSKAKGSPPIQKKQNKQTLADKADKYDCYQQSVQEPEHEIDIFDQAFREAYNRKALKLREDFCGTFAVCCYWVESDSKRSAWGIDLCEETLQWGKNNNLNKLKEKDSRRVTVMEQDVRERSTPQVDVLAAQNFSFWIFKTREEVLEYFKIAYANLASEGVIVMDMMGGRDCYDSDLVDKRTIVKGKKGFKYHWEQAYFNPVNSHCKFYIHFKFADGSKMKKAFQYDWRFWTIPEVRELLMEAGFKDTVVYWEEDTEDATWSKVDEAPNDYSWLCYVVGIK
ncbi:MAG: SAM-dependent methyltransferase [OM182 bacterium MED-G28]|uniref:SAM-dependent methyltransferase n=1 Tax=OM182 bacterium MED-G28 TaxID=1986256 RepID=A0A2A5WBV7_9GAMM|nr:MAG: SAM-dependent methyltransferase [OM182 bacterium MED-G28]|tara:strand:- start:64 stop:909 length:846 start_codon:yes stop_codon:yes gene_type:complete